MKLIVKTQDGAEIHFTVSVDTPLEQIFDAVCSMKNMNRSEAMFRFEGDHIKPLCTPKLLEMEDGDVIDMLVSLVGD